MEGSVSIRDYRAVKEADIDLKEGILLIAARNGAGKSTVFKALKALCDGAFGGEENFRHGVSRYSIRLTVGDRSVEAVREGKETGLSVDGNPPVSKLGRNPLTKLAPDFPFKRVEYGDDVFYPNFSFQGKVPVFEDISVFDLFGSMFGEVSKVSARVDALKRERQSAGKSLEDCLASAGWVAQREAEASSWLRRFDAERPDFDRDYALLEERVALYRERQSLLESVALQESRPDFGRDALMLSLVDRSKELFPLHDLAQSVKPRADRVYALRSAIRDAEASLQSLQSIDTGLIKKGARVRELVSLMADTEASLTANAQERQELSDRLSRLVSDEAAFRASLESVEDSSDYLRVLSARFAESGCPYREMGVCPQSNA